MALMALEGQKCRGMTQSALDLYQYIVEGYGPPCMIVAVFN